MRRSLRAIVPLLLLLLLHHTSSTTINGYPRDFFTKSRGINHKVVVQDFDLSHGVSRHFSSEPHHVALVTVPVAHHFEPILNLAGTLLLRGHRVTLVVPQTYEPWVRLYGLPQGLEFLFTASPTKEEQTLQQDLLTQSIVSREDRSYQDVNLQTWYKYLTSFDFVKLSNILSRKGLYDTLSPLLSYYNLFHSPMLATILGHYNKTRLTFVQGSSTIGVGPSERSFCTDRRTRCVEKKFNPDIFIVDRYTFAGISAAQYLNVPFIINSPGPLSDVDNPANHVPAPLSGNSIHEEQSILGRCFNLIFRLRYRLANNKAYDAINEVRRAYRVGPVEGRQDVFGHTVVLANTIFGIDDPRPMSPLVVIVGSMTPGKNGRSNGIEQKESLHLIRIRKAKEKEKEKKNLKTIVVDLSSRVPMPRKVVKKILRTIKRMNFGKFKLFCIQPLVMDPLHRSLAGADETMIHDRFTSLYKEYCDDILLASGRCGRSNQGKKGTKSAKTEKYCIENLAFSPGDRPLDKIMNLEKPDAVILSGDAGKAFNYVVSETPLIVLPFFADQLDMAERLARVHCGVTVNPVGKNVIKSLEKAIRKTTKPGGCYRHKMIQSMQWMKGVLLSTGGVEEAALYVETVIRHGTASIVPHKDGLVWYEKFALDVYAMYAVVLLCLWLSAKFCSKFMWWICYSSVSEEAG